MPFELDRQAIDDVERGANDSDWQPVKDAARQIAFAEDRAIFEGYAAARIEGIRQGTSNPIMTLPADVRAISGRDRRRRSASCGSSASTVRTRWCSAPTPTPRWPRRSDHGYPVLEHIQRLVEDEIIWAPGHRRRLRAHHARRRFRRCTSGRTSRSAI